MEQPWCWGMEVAYLDIVKSKRGVTTALQCSRFRAFCPPPPNCVNVDKEKTVYYDKSSEMEPQEYNGCTGIATISYPVQRQREERKITVQVQVQVLTGTEVPRYLLCTLGTMGK